MFRSACRTWRRWSSPWWLQPPMITVTAPAGRRSPIAWVLRLFILSGHSVNNPKNCFSWFLPVTPRAATARRFRSKQMVELRRSRCSGSDRGEGSSSPASRPVARWRPSCWRRTPEVFAGGAHHQPDFPHGCAKSVQEAFEAMFPTNHGRARDVLWRSCSAPASDNHGPWPRISVVVWHGRCDRETFQVRKYHPTMERRAWPFGSAVTCGKWIGSHTRRTWNDIDGTTLIEAFSMAAGHGARCAARLGDGRGKLWGAGAILPRCRHLLDASHRRLLGFGRRCG